jgi:hypothetical protein
MFRAVPEFNKALAVVAVFHQFAAHALASRVTALPFVPFESAAVFVAHFFPHFNSSAHAKFFTVSLC